MLRPPAMHSGTVVNHEIPTASHREGHPSSANSKLASFGRAAANAFMNLKSGFHDGQSETNQLVEDLMEERNRLRAELQELQTKHQFQLERLQKDCCEAEEEAAEARRELQQLRQEFSEYRQRNLTELELVIAKRMQEPNGTIGRQDSQQSIAGGRDLVAKRLEAMEEMLGQLESAVGINVIEIPVNTQPNEAATRQTMDENTGEQSVWKAEVVEPLFHAAEISQTTEQSEPQIVHSNLDVITPQLSAFEAEPEAKQVTSLPELLSPPAVTVRRKPVSAATTQDSAPTKPLPHPISIKNPAVSPILAIPKVELIEENDEWKSSVMDLLNRL